MSRASFKSRERSVFYNKAFQKSIVRTSIPCRSVQKPTTRFRIRPSALRVNQSDIFFQNGLSNFDIGLFFHGMSKRKNKSFQGIKLIGS